MALFCSVVVLMRKFRLWLRVALAARCWATGNVVSSRSIRVYFFAAARGRLMHCRSRLSSDFFIRPSLQTQAAASTIFCPAPEYKRPSARIQKRAVGSTTRPILACSWARTIRATTYGNLIGLLGRITGRRLSWPRLLTQSRVGGTSRISLSSNRVRFKPRQKGAS